MIQFTGFHNGLQKKYPKMRYYNVITYDEGFVYPCAKRINNSIDFMHYKGFQLNKIVTQKLVKT